MKRRRPRPSRPSLSIVCGTHHPGPLVAAALAPLRCVADEIVVGADERVSASDLAWYGSVADTLLTYPFTGPNQFRGWICEHVAGDWILFLDGDEVVSDRLIQQLPDLMGDRDIASYLVRKDWLFPDIGHRLVDAPWFPDQTPRLLRNDDRLWFPSVKHSGPESTGPARRIDASILHLDLLITDEQQRTRKVELYESQSFGLLTNGGPFNELYYLPELRAGVMTAPIDEADRRRVAEVLEQMSRADGTRRRAWPWQRRSRPITARGSADDIRRALPWEPLGDADIGASIRLFQCPTNAPAGSRFQLEVVVENLSGRAWPYGWTTQPAIRVSYHWRRGDTTVIADGIRTPLPHPVRPGGDVALTCLVEVPAQTGAHDLVFDLVAEGDRWFGLDVVAPVDVTAHPRTVMHAAEVGELVPLDQVLELRRQLALPDEMERLVAGCEQAAELDAELLAVLGDSQLGGWALDIEVLATLVETFRRVLPRTVVQFGSGMSTIVLAHLALRGDIGGVEVISVEQDPAEAERVGQLLADRGLLELVRIVVAPLADVEMRGVRMRCYDQAIVDAALCGRSPGLILIDGPSRADGGNRFPTLLMVQPHLRHQAVFLLNDAWRDIELVIAERWGQCPGVYLDGIAAAGKGALLGRIDPIVIA